LSDTLDGIGKPRALTHIDIVFFDLMIEGAIYIFRCGFCNFRGHTKIVIISSDQIKRESWGWYLNLGS